MRYDTLTSVLRRALVLGGIVGGVIGVVSALIGLAVAGWGGFASGLVGAVLTILFLGITAAGLILVGRTGSAGSMAPFAVLMSAWFVKLVVFIIVMVVLEAQPWVVPGVLFASIICTVLASLVIDSVVVGRARIPVSDRV